ncbi:MAG TPA: COX15/CtaA family protein [Kiritimatiellia bacterium]|nr:COX15/CtaA family protein [Kiritimatiellia bacterium]
MGLDFARGKEYGARMNRQMEMVDLHPVRIWLGLVLGMILLIVAVGGITRLTESGLSMVTWEPILGIIPPLSEAEWERRFDQYRQFPEYQQLRKGMTMDEFKVIFFWEYFHRLLGRLLGVIYAIPLFWFWLKKHLDRDLKIKLLTGLFLGGGQGVMGWYMVKSGLVNDPYVSHYRLAAHLGLAFIVFGYLLWVLLTIQERKNEWPPASRRSKIWCSTLGLLLCVQILWGAFVAGLNAGYFYNTFPTMQGHWIAPYWNQLSPLWLNAFDNPIAVQWIHRTLGIFLTLLAMAAWVDLRRDPSMIELRRTGFSWFIGTLLLQFWLGVFTLVLSVPIALAVMHQVTACILVGLAVIMNYALFSTHERHR